MLKKCANPGCDKPFRRLEDGKLFLVEVEASPTPRTAGEGGGLPQLQYYWLCDLCALVLTLSFEAGRGVAAVPLARPIGRRLAALARTGEVVATPSNRHRPQAALGSIE
ncbi:MAG: hypothetical protein ACRD3L_18840 [Terriglobales bacterium]